MIVHVFSRVQLSKEPLTQTTQTKEDTNKLIVSLLCKNPQYFFKVWVLKLQVRLILCKFNHHNYVKSPSTCILSVNFHLGKEKESTPVCLYERPYKPKFILILSGADRGHCSIQLAQK